MAEVLAVKNGRPCRATWMAHVKDGPGPGGRRLGLQGGLMSRWMPWPPWSWPLARAGRMGYFPKSLLERDGEPLLLRQIRLLGGRVSARWWWCWATMRAAGGRCWRRPRPGPNGPALV